MRVRTTAATAAILLAVLTSCGDSGEKEPVEKPPTKASSSKHPDGGDTEETLKLGDPAQTIGDEGVGVLEITPDTVVYAKQDGDEKAANGVFAVVTMKDRAMTGTAADEVAPISGGGWSWIAPDGEAIGFGSGNSTNVVLDKYNNSDPVQPGTYQWRSQVFDLSPAQAKGGTLLYTDGDGTAHRWKMPSTDTGPNVTEVKKELQP